MENKEKSVLAQHIDGFITHMEVLNLAQATLDTTRFKLGKFDDWCVMRGLEDPNQFTLQTLESFQKYLARYKKRGGEKMIVSTQHAILSTVKNLFQWMRRQGHVTVDSSEDLQLPKLPPKKLPNKGLTDEEVAKLFRSQDVNTKLGLKNMCILSVLYATGIRREELTKIDIQHLDLKDQTIKIFGKGSKERMVILGDAACKWLEKYLSDARPLLDKGNGDNALFLNKNGERISTKGLSHTMQTLFKKAGVEVEGSTHLWRHTFCTQLVGGGCNLVYAQKLMGHASLEYISRYTSYNMDDLKEAHKKHHPAA